MFEYEIDGETIVIPREELKEKLSQNPGAKFVKEVEPGKTNPSKETEDAPVEENNTASRLEDGSLVYQEASVGELVNKIQEAERQGEAVLFPPGMGELDKIALEEVIIGIEKPQEKSVKDQQTLAQRMAVYQPPITPGEEIKEDILKGIVEYDPRTDEEKDQEAFIAEEKKKEGEILQAPSVIEAEERRAEALYPTNFKKKPDSFSESISNSFGNQVLDLEGMSPRIKGLLGTFAKRGMEGMGYDTSDKSLEGEWYNKYIAEGQTSLTKEKSRSKLAKSFTDIDIPNISNMLVPSYYKTPDGETRDFIEDTAAATIDGLMSFVTSIAKLRLGVGFITKGAKVVKGAKQISKIIPGKNIVVTGREAFDKYKDTKTTFGLLWTDIAARQIQNYNSRKAKAAGISLNELYDNNDAEIVIPLVGAAITYKFEKAQIKSLTNYMADAPSSLLKQFYATTGLFNRNMFQEYLQYTNEEFNLYIGELKGQGYKLDGEGATKGVGELLGKKFFEIASSDAAIDAGLKGGFGATALTGPTTISNSYKILNQSDKDRRNDQTTKKNILLESSNNLDLPFQVRSDAQKRADRIELEMRNDVMNRDVKYDKLLPEQKENVNKAWDAKNQAESARAKVLNNEKIGEAEKQILGNIYFTEIQRQSGIIENILQLQSEQEKIDKIVKNQPITVVPYATATSYEDKGFVENSVEAVDPDNNTISINLEKAADIGNVTPFRHGALHGVLAGTFTKKQLEEAVNILKSELDEETLSAIEKKLSLYTEDQNTPDEFLTQYYEIAKKNGAFENKSFLNKIGDLQRDILRSVGYTNIKFDDTPSIKNFLSDYDKAFGRGELLEGTKMEFNEKAYSKGILELYNKYNKSAEDMVIETFSGQTDVLNTEFGQSIGGLVESITKRLFDGTLPDVTKVINENRGEARKQFKRQVIEDAAIMVLNEFDESKQSIDKFISNRLNLRANAVLKNMGVMPSVDKGGLGMATEATDDTLKGQEQTEQNEDKIDQAEDNIELKKLDTKISFKRGGKFVKMNEVQIPGETVTEVIDDKKITRPRTFSDNVLDAVIKTFQTKLPNVNEKAFIKKFDTANQAEIIPLLQEEFAVTKDKDGNKVDKFRLFLQEKNNFEGILGKLPQSVINKRFKTLGQKTGRETIGAGKGIFEKTNVTQQEFVEYFSGRDLASNVRSDRKKSLIRVLANELAADATLEALTNPNVIEKLGVQGIVVNEAWTNGLKKAIQRDQLSIDDLENRNKDAGIKYSKVIAEAESQELNSKQVDDFLSIYLKDKNKAYDKNPDLYIAVQEDYARVKGIGAEQRQGDIIKLANKNNKGFVMVSTAAGNDFKVIDYQVKINGVAEGVENKGGGEGAGSNNYGMLGRILGNTENLRTNNGNMLAEDILTRKEAQPFIKSLDKLAEVGSKILGIKKEDFDFTKQNTAFMIDKGHTDQWESKIFVKKTKGLQAEVERNGKFPISEKIVINHNKTKDVNFPGTGLIDEGLLYSFNGTTLGVNAPILKLSPEVSFRVRTERIMEEIDGVRTKVGFFPKIIAEYRVNNITEEKGIDVSTLEKAEQVFSNIKYSKVGDLEKEVNGMIERKKNIPFESTFSEPQARRLGERMERIKLFVPFTSEDLLGLTYRFLGKGKQGDKDMLFFKENLFTPLTKANIEFEAAQQESDRALIAAKDIIAKQGVDLTAEAIDGYTNDHVIRIFMWNRRGYKVPDLDPNTKGDKPGPEQAKIVKYARQQFDIVTIADALESAYPDFQYGKPNRYWVTGTVTTDLLEFTNNQTREQVYEGFFNNVEGMFGKFDKRTGRLTGPIANKIRRGYGNTFIKALESSIYRIHTGRNRSYQLDQQGNVILDWMNNAIGNIMFINSRSAVLQTLSSINFTNWTDNNPLQITKAWANNKQFGDDFKTIFFSDYLTSRRSGLRTDVQEQEIAEAAKNSKNKVRSMIAVILKKGFMPTQYADSFAIALGGASFYRNRTNTYVKQGMDKADAEQKAFEDMREIAEDTQQSGRPEKISMEQSGLGGRLILAFQNTPMQYNRLIKRGIQDLYAGRGDAKTNISKIITYGIIQNAIFYAMQQALFTILFDEPETTDEEKKEKKRYYNLINGMADSILRGSGMFGALVSTGKNTLLKVLEREGFDEKAIEEIANLSPPLGKKTRQLFDIRDKFQYKQNKQKIKELGLDTRNPAILAAADALSFGINLPADRALKKINNLRTASEKETEMWQRIALSLGWSNWELNIDTYEKSTSQPKPKLKGLSKKRNSKSGGLKRKRLK